MDIAAQSPRVEAMTAPMHSNHVNIVKFFKREESESIVKIDEIPGLEDHFADPNASEIGETYR